MNRNIWSAVFRSLALVCSLLHIPLSFSHMLLQLFLVRHYTAALLGALLSKVILIFFFYGGDLEQSCFNLLQLSRLV